MSSKAVVNRQGVITGAGAAMDIQEAGLEWETFELLDKSNLILYKKTRMLPGKETLIIQNHDTDQLSLGNAITLDGDKVTIEASVLGAADEFAWSGTVR